MLKDTILYRSAILDGSNMPVDIKDIDRSFAQQHSFHCPHCKRNMYATFGKKHQPHFRHNGDKCHPDKYLHDLAEAVFYDEYNKCLNNGSPFILELTLPIPCNNACVLRKHLNCKEHFVRKTVDLTKEYTIISLEHRVEIDQRYRKPDILLESLDGNQLWIEIWVSHETEEEKRIDGRIIELKIRDLDDLNTIRQHKIVQPEGEDDSIRCFNFESIDDELFSTKEIASRIKLPCENYYCFEKSKDGFKSNIVGSIIDNINIGLTYRIILRLNWKNNYNDFSIGPVGHLTSEEELRFVCSSRYLSYYHDDNDHSLGNYLDTLIAYEWKAESFATVPHQTMLPRPPVDRYSHKTYQPKSEPKIQTPPPVIDTSSVEWIDLGLPSGILWAKEDIDIKLSFTDATKACGQLLPSVVNAREILDNCKMQWDAKDSKVILTGPNGTILSFTCKGFSKSYWLNSYLHGNKEYAQCIRISHSPLFLINDEDVVERINIRLVKKNL